MVRERKGRERKYTGGGRKLEEYGRKGEGGGGRGSYLPGEDTFFLTYRAHGYVLRIFISHEALTCSWIFY